MNNSRGIVQSNYNTGLCLYLPHPQSVCLPLVLSFADFDACSFFDAATVTALLAAAVVVALLFTIVRGYGGRKSGWIVDEWVDS